ncbi:hypothetical protein ABBQ38_008066 [Trebouxia sp. C0009 RCD-2024]
MVTQLVLVRHGQSVYNEENKFTGWVDVELTAAGLQEAVKAGKLLKAGGFLFDVAFTSVLKRCIVSLHTILEETEQLWIPERKCWQLNERHYGDLEDQVKSEVAATVGEKQAKDWRRSYATQPPADQHHSDGPSFVGDGPCHAMAQSEMPLTESLQDTFHRILPLWHDSIAPAIRSGQKVLIVAHGNSIRALIKHLQGISDEDIPGLYIPIGIPLVYELDENLHAIKHHQVADDSKSQD